MKKIITLAILAYFSIAVNGQTNAIDELFDKYSEKDGFTTVYISGKMLSLFKGEKEGKGKDVVNRLNTIKILTVEDSVMNQKLNFWDDISSKVNLSSFDELMVTKEGRNVTKFLVRQKGDIITDLLVISGGPGHNSLISIKGNLDLKTLSELSDDTGIDELKDLEKADKKKQ